MRHGARTGTAASPPQKTVYTCPMHPEIEREEPGSCPKCGMDLEPKYVDGGGRRTIPRLADMTRRFWVAVALGVPVFPAGHAADVGVPVDAGLGRTALALAAVDCCTPVVLWAGWPFFRAGRVRSIVTWNLNMFTLIALGTGAAYFYSAVAMLFPGVFPEAFQARAAVEVYFEAAAMIIALVLLGQVLELRPRRRTGQRHP